MAKNNEANYFIEKLECEEFDKRLHQRHVNEGRTTREALGNHLSTLPDVASEAVRLSATFVETRRRAPKVSEHSED